MRLNGYRIIQTHFCPRVDVASSFLRLASVFSRLSQVKSVSKDPLQNQDRQWSRHAARYDEIFLDPFSPGVHNPLLKALDDIPNKSSKSVADLGCGTGPLLPILARDFASVTAIDFAPAMISCARQRLDENERARVTFLERPMHQLDDLAGKLDVAVAVNSLVMPDVRVIDQTLRAIRATLKSEGLFLGIVPSIDAISYHIMLIMDQELDQGANPRDAERAASLEVERRYYDFVFGRFHYQGLRQKFWQPFELEYRLEKAGFTSPIVSKVLYPWQEVAAESSKLSDHPRSWDWFFLARK
jgi:SAM-dependent methyltransferase